VRGCEALVFAHACKMGLEGIVSKRRLALPIGPANKLSRSFAILLDALNRHRGKGQQKVTVEHVHVHSGGQAVVGLVDTAGARKAIRGSRRCKANYPCTSALGAEQKQGKGARANRPRCRTAGKLGLEGIVSRRRHSSYRSRRSPEGYASTIISGGKHTGTKSE
jgi:hypothetical protein